MTNLETFQSVSTGYRMGKPVGCSDTIHDMMLKCWDVIPANRPSFEDIEKFFANLEVQKIVNEPKPQDSQSTSYKKIKKTKIFKNIFKFKFKKSSEVPIYEEMPNISKPNVSKLSFKKSIKKKPNFTKPMKEPEYIDLPIPNNQKEETQNNEGILLHENHY